MYVFVCFLIIVVISIGLGRAYRFGGRFGSHHMRDKPQRDGPIFMVEVDPSRHHVKILIWQLEEG